MFVAVILAPPDHRDPVCDGQNLVQLVCDEHDSLTLVLHHAEGLEQIVDLSRREHGGGLIEDQHLDPAIQQLEDLDALLFTDGELPDTGRGIDRQPVFLAEGGGGVGLELSHAAGTENDRRDGEAGGGAVGGCIGIVATLKMSSPPLWALR